MNEIYLGKIRLLIVPSLTAGLDDLNVFLSLNNSMILNERTTIHSRIFQVDYKKTKGFLKKAYGSIAKLTAPNYFQGQNLDIVHTHMMAAHMNSFSGELVTPPA